MTVSTYKGNAGRGVGYNNQQSSFNNVAAEATDDLLSNPFMPNVLDNYDAVTYHWKCFIVDLETASSGLIMDDAKQIIIAESGVTDISIEDVLIKSVATPSVDTGTGMSTIVTFTLLEPGGAGMYDKLFYKSIAMGVGNWLTMPFYLQLSFRARDPSTSLPIGDIDSLRWVWQLKLTDTKAHVSAVGTKYELSAIVYNDLAQSNVYSNIQHNITLQGLKTVDDAIKELQQKLNDDQLIKLVDSYSVPDIYEFVVDSKIAKYRLTSSKHNEDSFRAGTFDALDEKDATFGPGTSIDKIIDTLMSHTIEYQTSLIGARTPGANGAPINEETSHMKKIWRIITETRPTSFDARRCDDARIFTIYIVDYDIGVLDANTLQDTNSTNTISAERRRLDTYLKNGILRKKYNYMFTGLNDQIIDFDLTINHAFAAAVSRFNGVYSNTAMSTVGLKIHNNAEEEANISKLISAAISYQHSSASANTSTASDAMSKAIAAIESSKLSPEEQMRRKNILLYSKSSDKLNIAKFIAANGGIQQDGTVAQKDSRSTNTGDSSPVQISSSFISDVDIYGSEIKSAYESHMLSAKGKLRPVAHIEQNHDKEVGSSIESSSNSGIQKVSSMFSVALHSSLDVSLVQIKLVIKGDPYWLFPQPVQTNSSSKSVYKSVSMNDAEAIAYFKNAHRAVTVDAVNMCGTDNFIILRFRSPRYFSEALNTDDNDAYTDLQVYSGVYKVITVENKFVSGKFTQELFCIIDYNIDLENHVETLSKMHETKPSGSDLLPQKQPDTVEQTIPQQKTNRLNETVDTPGATSITRDTSGNIITPNSALINPATYTNLEA